MRRRTAGAGFARKVAMNYRHAYHAGNFADVVKHAVFARVVAHLKEKPTAFRIIDTHAGAGLTDLAGAEATRTGEWQAGIGRLLSAPLPADVAALLAPYLAVVRALNAGRGLATYPGSPLLARAWLRPQDRLLACEIEPKAAAALARRLKGDERTTAVMLDGWTALCAWVPPKERRGAVLIDPPFEQPDEFERMREKLREAHRKWSRGIYLLWYPIKDRHDADAFAQRLARLGIAKILRAEIMVETLARADRLIGSGLVVVNPPWRLERELAILLPALAAVLARDRRGRSRVDWLAGEN